MPEGFRKLREPRLGGGTGQSSVEMAERLWKVEAKRISSFALKRTDEEKFLWYTRLPCLLVTNKEYMLLLLLLLVLLILTLLILLKLLILAIVWA